ncbi:hypothetical protein ACCO45_001365 [Purpureocillium lilacinum]|uniref:Uncharacterized protein n=1 Tax=Purpureocillium lilacinum TaxID=33203 RepID=A0ACC4E9L8_PURLI
MSTIPPSALQSGFPPTIPLPFNSRQPEKVTLYPLSNYTFGVKETQPEEDPSVIARLKRLEEHFAEHGMRRTCEGILVCHEHNHPHILMLQIANAFFKLPGDYLRPEDDEVEGSRRASTSGWRRSVALAKVKRPATGKWPSRTPVTKQLPYSSTTEVLSVPKNMKLLAVPLFELYDNTARYGPQLSAIPHILSRYNFEFVDDNGNVVAVTPGAGAPEGYVPKTKVLAGDDTDMKENEENGTQ